MRFKLVTSLGVCLLLCLTATINGSCQQSGLSFAQVEHLVKLHAPDGLVATQIEARGISFAATKAHLASWTTQGAGPHTLDALRALILTGSVQLRTEPGAATSLDGKTVGTTNAAGFLLLDDVVPGPHQLVITKSGFRACDQPFTLGDREARDLSAPLTWGGGLLTVSAQPTSASIAVTGPVSFSGPIDGAHCPPGEYTITVSMAGYASQTHPLTIASGQNYQQHFQLEVDPAFLKKALADAQASFSTGDLDSAIRLSMQVMSLAPSNPMAYAILAEASFKKGDMRGFSENASRAIQGGQSITIPLMHLHLFPRQLLHRVDMTITGGGLAFVVAPGVKCKIPALLNYPLIESSSVARDSAGNAVLHLVWSEHPQGFGVPRELDFVPLGSGYAKAQPPPGTIAIFTQSVLQIPRNSDAQYQAIINLIEQVRR